jgi:UDP-glucose 4-epimerase
LLKSTKKILITGGLGYLGSHTTVVLQQAGYEVVSADNHSNSQADVAHRIARITGIQPRNYEIDVCDRQALTDLFEAEGPFAGVIHMAAHKSVGESVAEPLKYYHNNLLSLLQVLHCCEQFGVAHLVFSSTCTVYGEPAVLPVTENTPVNPLSPYGQTKLLCEQMLQDFVRTHPMQALSLRFFNPVGAHPSGEIGELPNGVPSNLLPFMAQTAAGLHPYLRIWGDDYPTPDGSCIRDYIHVCDLAEVHLKALEWLFEQNSKQGFEVLNVGTGQGISVKQMVTAFEQTLHVTLPKRVLHRRAGDIVTMYADSQKAAAMLQWVPRFTLAQMVQTTWLWQQNMELASLDTKMHNAN